MEFAAAVRKYAEEQADEAIEYVRANPSEYLNEADHAIIVMQMNIVKGLTGMTWGEICERMNDEVEKQLKALA